MLVRCRVGTLALVGTLTLVGAVVGTLALALGALPLVGTNIVPIDGST